MSQVPTIDNSSDGSATALGAGLPEPKLAAEAIARVLRPMARLMIDHGLQLPDMVELLKEALVDEASNAFGLADKGSSDTRISLLTGVHRKDVRRLRSVQKAEATDTTVLPVAATVVARWLSEPRYLHADQTARALARTPKRSQPGEPDFTTLVGEISRDLGARAVLDELLRLGVVELHADGSVALRSHGFAPKEGLRESFHFLAANVSDHLSAAVHNMAPNRTTPAKLEQCIYSDELSQPQVDELHKLARQLWTKALQPFLRAATVADQRSKSHPGPKFKIRFGVYFNDTLQSLPGAAPAESAKGKRIKKKVTQ